MPKNQDQQSAGWGVKLLAALLILVGAGTIVLGVAANWLGLSNQPGFGPNKILLTLIGSVILLSGVILTTPAGRRFLTRIIQEAKLQATWRVRPADTLLLAIWFGLVTGLAEVIAWAILKLLFSYKIIAVPSTSLNVIWMAPLADMVFFSLLGLLFWLISWRWPVLVLLPVVTFIFALLGFLSLILMVPGLQLYATLLLAAGLAVQVARWAAKQPHRFRALVYSTLGWPGIFQKSANRSDSVQISKAAQEDSLPGRRQFLLGAGATVAGLAVGTSGWEKLVEWQALAKLPPAPQNAPNILLIVWDTVRASNLSLHGYSRPTTPNLARLAKTGVCFEQAITTAPWTLPSHASMFTGRWHHQLSADLNSPLDSDYPTLAEVLSQQGYLTAGFVANLEFCNTSYGLNRGFAHYEDFPVSLGQMVLSTSLGREITDDDRVRQMIGYQDSLNRKDASQVTSDFLKWLSGQKSQPFFAFLNYYDAHQPYFPPAPFDSEFGPKRGEREFRYYTNVVDLADPWKLPLAEVQVELDAYDGAIAYLDQQLGLLLDELAQRGVLENTVVIITSDHGEQIGEHGLFGHTNSLYIQTLHVPLLVLSPGRLPAGQRVTQPVSLRDLSATVMDLAGLGAANQFPGVSLARYWQPGSEAKGETLPLLSEINSNHFVLQDWYPIARGDMKSLVIDRYHYIKNGDGNEELFDWVNDPAETHDLAASEEGRQIIAHCRTSLQTMLGA